VESAQDLHTLLAAAARTGEPLDLAAETTIPAAVLRDVLVDTATAAGRRWIALDGVTIEGDLDLDAAHLTCGLRATDCTFTGDLVMQDARSPRLVLNGSRFRHLFAMGLQVDGDLELSGTTIEASVDLRGARVHGSLYLTDSRLGEASDRTAFFGDLLSVGGSIFANGLACQGALRLMAAETGAQCQFSKASLTGAPTALNAARFVVGGALIFDEEFQATQRINLADADIQGELFIEDARFTTAGETAIELDGARIGSDIVLRRAEVGGQLRMSAADVQGSLVVEGGRFVGDGYAIGAWRLRVRDNADIDGTELSGTLGLQGVFVGGSLTLHEVQLSVDEARDALELNAGRLGGDLKLISCTANGALSLVNTSVAGVLWLNGTEVSARDDQETAILADGLEVVGDARFGRGFTAFGQVSLIGTHFGSSLVFDGALLSRPAGTALDLERTRVDRILALGFESISGTVDLTDATLSSIRDRQDVWPDRLLLGGLRYERIVAWPNDVSVKERLDWVARQDGGYLPQPYAALAASYRNAGYEEKARTVVIAGRRRRRKELRLPSQAWDFLLDRGIAYGYATWRAVVGLLVLAVLGVVVFSAQFPEHFTATKTGDAQPPFHAITYTLDVLVPVISLRQRDAWTPDGYALAWSVALTFLGWVLTTAVVAALTGLLRRE
jgi:hypothetical protein